MSETSYVRTRRGAMVHRRACPWLADGGVTNPANIYPWNWAEGKTVAEITAYIAEHNIPGIRFCKVCIGTEAGT